MLVALTGYGREEDKRDALRAGFDRHLVKPVVEAVLVATQAGLPPPTTPTTRLHRAPIDK